MLGQELKRVFQNIWIWIAFLLCLLLGIYVSDFIMQSEYRDSNTSFEEYTAFSMQYDGQDIKSVYQELKRIQEEGIYSGGSVADEYAYIHVNWKLLTRAEALAGYSDFLTGVKTGSQSTIFDSAYVKKRTEKAKKDYADLQVDITTWNANDSAEVFLSGRSMDVFLLLFVFVLIYYLFLMESEQGMIRLTRTTKYGMRQFYLSKQLILLAGTVFTVLVYESVWLLYLVSRYGAFTPGAPMQSVYIYMNCRYAIPVWQGILLYVLLKALAVYVIAAIISLLTVVCRRTLPALISLVLISAAEVLLYNLLGYNMSYDVLSRLNLIELMDLPARVLSYDYVNLFGEPIPLFLYQLVMSLLLMIVCILLGVKFYGTVGRRRRYRAGKPVKERPIHLFRHGMVLHEIKKLLIDYRILIPYLIFAVAIALFIWKGGRLALDMNEQFYQGYMEEMNGPLTPEKEERIQEEKAYFEKLRELEMQILMEQEGSAALGYIETLLNKEQAFERVLNQYERIQNGPDDMVFVYDTGYAYLDGQREYPVQDMVILFSLVIMAVLIPYCNQIEYEGGAYRLVRTTRYGIRRLPVVRWSVQAGITCCYTLFLYAVCFFNVILQYGSFGLTQKMQNLAWVSGWISQLPIWLFCVLQLLIWEMVALVFMTVLYTITNLTKDYVKAVLLGLLLGPLPYYILRFV